MDVIAPGSSGPAYCFVSEDGRILLLYGQWLLDSDTYRAAPNEDGVDLDEADNDFHFPSDHFVLHFWPGETQPFWIEVLGKYLKPQDSFIELRGTKPIEASTVFAGTLETLQTSLDNTFA